MLSAALLFNHSASHYDKILGVNDFFCIYNHNMMISLLLMTAPNHGFGALTFGANQQTLNKGHPEQHQSKFSVRTCFMPHVYPHSIQNLYKQRANNVQAKCQLRQIHGWRTLAASMRKKSRLSAIVAILTVC